MTTTETAVDTDLLDAALTAGPKADRTLTAIREIVEILSAGALDFEHRIDLAAQLVADTDALRAFAQTVLDGAGR